MKSRTWRIWKGWTGRSSVSRILTMPWIIAAETWDARTRKDGLCLAPKLASGALFPIAQSTTISTKEEGGTREMEEQFERCPSCGRTSLGNTRLSYTRSLCISFRHCRARCMSTLKATRQRRFSNEGLNGTALSLIKISIFPKSDYHPSRNEQKAYKFSMHRYSRLSRMLSRRRKRVRCKGKRYHTA